MNFMVPYKTRKFFLLSEGVLVPNVMAAWLQRTDGRSFSYIHFCTGKRRRNFRELCWRDCRSVLNIICIFVDLSHFCVYCALLRGVVDPAGNCYSGSVARRMTEIKLQNIVSVQWLERQRNFRHILERPSRLFVCVFVCMHGRVASTICCSISLRTVVALHDAANE